MQDQGGYHNGCYDLDEQASIDVDLETSRPGSSSGNSKRQTVILASEKRQDNTNGGVEIQANQPEAECDISMESLVFIHIELPLFPLSTFVPKTLQDATALKHTRLV